MDLRLSSTAISSRDDLHDILSTALSFPPTYGKNLDALYDCLLDVFQPVTIRLDEASLTPILGQSYMRRLLSLLHQATIENPCLTILIE